MSRQRLESFLLARGVLPPEIKEEDSTAATVDPAEDPAFQQMLDLVDPTERDALIKARVNQSDFRNALSQRWGGCAVNGCNVTEVLISSHLKSWNRCTTRAERLSPANGLLLVPTLDNLLDRGLLSFDDQFRILFSPQLRDGYAMQLNVNRNMRLKSRLDTGVLPFLHWHRENVFCST